MAASKSTVSRSEFVDQPPLLDAQVCVGLSKGLPLLKSLNAGKFAGGAREPSRCALVSIIQTRFCAFKDALIIIIIRRGPKQLSRSLEVILFSQQYHVRRHPEDEGLDQHVYHMLMWSC